jgi:hypothetical protein
MLLQADLVQEDLITLTARQVRRGGGTYGANMQGKFCLLSYILHGQGIPYNLRCSGALACAAADLSCSGRLCCRACRGTGSHPSGCARGDAGSITRDKKNDFQIAV